MMWAHTIVKTKVQTTDVESADEIRKLASKSKWLWIDCLEPDEKELETIAELAKEKRIVNLIKKAQISSQYERSNEHNLIPVLLVNFKEKLEIHNIYVITHEKIFITVRNGNSSKSTNNTLRTLQNCIKEINNEAIPSFVISRLFHEATNENLETIMALREYIDALEEKALDKPADKKLSKDVFRLKREVSTLERVFWVQKETMLAINEGIVPPIQTSERDRLSLNHAISNISRELSLINSHKNTLDGILRLQDLGMIHRVERILIYLTMVTIIMNAVLILWETGILQFW